MRLSRFFYIMLLCLLSVWPELLQAQSLQVALSQAPKVNRTTSGGTATIFFDSSIEDLSIVCTEEDPNESIVKINDHQWFVNIDVNKDIEADGVCYRNYLLKCSASAEYFLTTNEIAPNQVLYYTITLPNELESQLIEAKGRDITKAAEQLVADGDSYLARLLIVSFLSNHSNYKSPQIERTLRRAVSIDNAKLYGHKDAVTSVQISRDSSYIVSASKDKTIRLWDYHSGKCLMVFDGHVGSVNCASFNSIGTHVASASDDKTIRVWNTQTGKCEAVLQGHSSYVSSVLFSNDDSLLISSSGDNTIRIWNTKTWECIKTLRGHTSQVSCIAMNSTGDIIASGSYDYSVRIWDVKTGNCLRILKGHNHFVRSVSFSPNDEWLASGAEDNRIMVWNYTKGEKAIEFKGHKSAVYSAYFNATCDKIVSSSLDNTIRIWDIKEKNVNE